MKTLLLTVSLAVIAPLSAMPVKQPPAAPAPNCEIGIAPSKFSDRSIFRLTAEWTDDAGKKVRLEDFRGRPMVLAMFFTSCQHSCPFIAREMKAMQTALAANAADRTQFVMVSIDPDRDSAAALKEFRRKLKLTGRHWTLLTGSPDSVRQLAEKIGFNYAPGSKTQFAHSLLITVLGGTGEVAHQQAGLGVDRREAIATVEKLAKAKAAR